MIQRDGLVDLLSQAGDFEVEEACDGRGALEIVADRTPDVVILDVELPGEMSGFDVARWLIGNQRPCSIIMLTARNSDEDAAEGLSAGAVTYIAKPVLLRVLLAQINSLVNAGMILKQNAIPIGGFTLFPVSRLLVGQRPGGDEQGRNAADGHAIEGASVPSRQPGRICAGRKAAGRCLELCAGGELAHRPIPRPQNPGPPEVERFR